jgi:glycosyltransferase involved in cell wall biosynthesis
VPEDSSKQRGLLRIAHLTATFPPYPGGAGNTCFQFASRQAELGHHVEVYTAPAEGEAPDPGGALVHRIPPLLAVGNAPLIPRLARLDGFDVLHLHYPFIFGSELVLAGRLRPSARKSALLLHYKNRLVATGARGAIFGAYEHTVAPLLVRGADRVCVLSREHAGSVPYLRRALRDTPERMVEMPNGVDAEAFAPGPDAAGIRASLAVPGDAVVAAFVATLDRAHRFKRLDVAIEALARTREERLHLIVAGGGELLEGYRRQATASGISDRVHFMGSVPHADLPGALRAADFLLLTTEPPESFGIVLIEGMACGLPVVASEYPGVHAVVEPDTNGLLVPRGEADATAGVLRTMVDIGAEGRRSLGEAGRAKAVREWAWPRLVERMDDAYRGAIDRRRDQAGRR